jgi:hypothetical protein
MSKLNEFQRTPAEMPSEQSRKKAQAAKEYIENMYKLQQQSIQERMERCASANVSVPQRGSLITTRHVIACPRPLVGGPSPLRTAWGAIPQGPGYFALASAGCHLPWGPLSSLATAYMLQPFIARAV